MFKIFSKNKTIAQRREQWFFALEKIVNIALVKTERNDNEAVKQILKELEKIFRKFWKLKKDNPEKFESLLWSTDFFDNYVIPLNKSASAEMSGLTKSAEELKREAGLKLAFTPEREMKGLTQFLNSFEKIWQAANRNNNDEISRYVVYHLNWLLAEISQEPDNQLFVEQFLKLLNSISHNAIKNVQRTGYVDPSIYSASINWYTDIVFNRLRQNDGFRLEYLDLFDKYFFSIVRYIVAEKQTAIFRSLVSSLVDGIHIPDYHRGEVWNYARIILSEDLQKYNKIDEEHKLKDKIKKLADSENNLHTQEKLEAWLKKFDELKAIIEPNLSEEQKKSSQETEKKIRDFAISQFKYQNLLEIVFAIGSYCLFKKRYDYIKHLWEYKQPSDSDASWIGHDITPKTLDEVTTFYFRKGLFEKKLDFWEEHHGSEKYYKQYFLLLLARILQSASVGDDSKYSQIKSYKLPDLHVHRLSDLEHSIESFIALATELKQAEDMLAEIGFDTSKLDETFDDKLVPFLNKLKEEAKKQISAKHKAGNISQKRVQEFKKEVLKTFYEGANMRDIFEKHFNAYEDKTKEETSKKERFGINIVDDKASFFDEWHVHYVGWGENYGRDLASGENSYLLDDIAKDCDEISKEEFEATLSKIGNPDDIVIFATNIAFWRFFEDSKNFKPKWHRDIEQLDIKGFGGWYEFNGQSIPVFETYHRKIDKQILILNKSKVGQLVQLSPLNEGEKEESVEDIFYMDIQAFSENEELMEEFIKKPPEWLQKVGDEQKQREHLRERVRIQIFERFEYNKPEGPEVFEGYKLLLNE